MNIISQSQPVMPELWVTFLKSAAMLCLVLAVLIAVLFLIKRMLNYNGGQMKPGLIRILSSHYVAPKEKVLLLDVLGEKILIGVTPHNINCIAKICDHEQPDSLSEKC